MAPEPPMRSLHYNRTIENARKACTADVQLEDWPHVSALYVTQINRNVKRYTPPFNKRLRFSIISGVMTKQDMVFSDHFILMFLLLLYPYPTSTRIHQDGKESR